MPDQRKLKEALEQLEKNGKVDLELSKLLDSDEKELLEDLKRKNLIRQSIRLIDGLDLDADWGAVKKRLLKTESTRKAPYTMLKYVAVFVGLAIGSYMIFKTPPTVVDEDTITLKIGDRKVKMIKEGENQKIVSADGTIVGEQKGNSLVYYNDKNMGELVYNELSVPYGKIFDIKLSDGTIVHLNSGSSIRYPVKFIGDGDRVVSLKGEAYFKVAKDESHPFIVNADMVSVEVLGTEFNVSSYGEDAEISTVLVEGAVQLTSSATEDKVVLNPGFKGGFDKNEHSIETSAVDLDLHVSWIKGELVFRKSSFEDMLKKLERKYDVSIHNGNQDLNRKEFNARFDVNVESIEDVMRSISSVTPFEYSIEGSKITIN